MDGRILTVAPFFRRDAPSDAPGMGVAPRARAMTALRLDVEHRRKQTMLLFDDLPIRIGRDPANECRLEFGFVSRVHARIERQGNRVMLRDEGSRLGTWTGRQRQRLAPRQFVDLAALHYEFQIGALRLRARPIDPSESRSAGLVAEAPAVHASAEPSRIEQAEASLAKALRDLGIMLAHQHARDEPLPGDLTTEQWRELLSALNSDGMPKAPQALGGLQGRGAWEHFVRQYALLRRRSPSRLAVP
jgi:hypothetical protein